MYVYSRRDGRRADSTLSSKLLPAGRATADMKFRKRIRIFPHAAARGVLCC